MKLNQTITLLLIVTMAVSGALAAGAMQQERKTKKVRRVNRPNFTQRDWDGIYFENLFEEGLVGDRPERAQPGMTAQAQTPAGTESASDQSESTGGLVWSKVIGRSTLEDEVKAVQNRLSTEITTPVKFKSEYAKAHQSFSMLSMLFGIIREYDAEVRWKKFAHPAQASFQKAAANSRVGSVQAYESCRTRKQDLEEMVRGGNFASDEQGEETLDWSNVVGHSPLMERLSEAKDRMKEMTSAEGAFKSGAAALLHESEIVSAMAEVLVKENMPYADEDDYVEFAKQMNSASVKIIEACKNQDYDSASKFANAVSQSCDDCHGAFR